MGISIVFALPAKTQNIETYKLTLYFLSGSDEKNDLMMRLQRD